MASPPQCPEIRPPTWREATFPKPDPVDMTPVLVEIAGEGRVVPRAAVRHLKAQEQMQQEQADLTVLASSPTAAFAYLGATAMGKSAEDRRRAMLVGAQVEALVVSARGGPALNRALGLRKELQMPVVSRRPIQVQRPASGPPPTDVRSIDSAKLKIFIPSPQSVKDKLTRYLLNPDHPKGADKAAWFRQALGFTVEHLDMLAEQIVFDPIGATETRATPFRVSYNQEIPIKGANGKIIVVRFGWTQDNTGVVKLVTAIPAKR